MERGCAEIPFLLDFTHGEIHIHRHFRHTRRCSHAAGHRGPGQGHGCLAHPDCRGPVPEVGSHGDDSPQRPMCIRGRQGQLRLAVGFQGCRPRDSEGYGIPGMPGRQSCRDDPRTLHQRTIRIPVPSCRWRHLHPRPYACPCAVCRLQWRDPPEPGLPCPPQKRVQGDLCRDNGKLGRSQEAQGRQGRAVSVKIAFTCQRRSSS